MKNRILLLAAITLPLMPLHAEEKTPEQIRQEQIDRENKETEQALLRRAGEREAKRELRATPEQAELAKQAFTRALQDQFRDPMFSLSTVPGGRVVLPKPLTTARITTLIGEVQKSLVPAEKTGTADWVFLDLPGLAKENYNATLLTPNFIGGAKAPCYGLKLINDAGDVAEFHLTSQEDAPQWVALMSEIHTAIAERDAKEATRPKPMTVAWTMEHASHVIPRMDLESTTMGDLLQYFRTSVGCGDGETPRVKLDDSLIQDRLDRPVINMHEKDITRAMAWSRAADAIGCDVVFGAGVIRFVPREP